MKRTDFTQFWWKNSGIDKAQLSIVLLAHVQQPRGHINQAQLQCSETERFSIEEFNEIYQGIVNAGYYIQAVYYNEFINYILSYNPGVCKRSDHRNVMPWSHLKQHNKPKIY